MPPHLEAALKDAGITEQILDPYGTGERLQFARIDDEPVIYSVGADAFGDDGQKEWNRELEGAGDWTFRFETYEESQRRRRLTK